MTSPFAQREAQASDSWKLHVDAVRAALRDKRIDVRSFATRATKSHRVVQQWAHAGLPVKSSAKALNALALQTEVPRLSSATHVSTASVIARYDADAPGIGLPGSLDSFYPSIREHVLAVRAGLRDGRIPLTECSEVTGVNVRAIQAWMVHGSINSWADLVLLGNALTTAVPRIDDGSE